MRQWSTCKVEDVRLGNIISIGGITDEVTGKQPSGRGGNEYVFLDLRDSGRIEEWRERFVEVYR